jgi:hypothetical protein
MIGTNSYYDIMRESFNKEQEFLEWFGGSKVVDSNGKPLLVYHGSRVEFDKFDSSKIGSRYGKDSRGFFFTIDPTEALGGAGDYGKGGSMKRAYLRIENPITLEAYASSIGASIEELMYYGGSEVPVISIWDEDKEEIMGLDKSADGVILRDSSLHPMNGMFVVFEVDQIWLVE